MNFRKTTSFIVGTAVIGFVFLSIFAHFTERADEGVTFDRPPIQMPIIEENRGGIIQELVAPAVEILPKRPAEPKLWSAIPFISQAPTAEWGKSEFQNGCEEASVLMVHAWRSGQAYTKETAKAELVALARFQEKKIGQGIDTDTQDTAKLLLGEYFDIDDYRIVYDFTLDELRQATAEGLIIVPTNGRALANPNFTAPGPLQHMLVVTGYDVNFKEFVTNDPGTQRGEGYRYPGSVLFAAIREYPTGSHLPIMTERKAMIVIPAAAAP